MTNFEGMNPYAYQKAAVELQKQRVAAQPHLQPQIEKAQVLPPAPKPAIETPKPAEVQAHIRYGVDRKANIGVGIAGIGLGLATEAAKIPAVVATETVKGIVREGVQTITGAERPTPRRLFQPPAPMQPRREAGRIHALQREARTLAKAA